MLKFPIYLYANRTPSETGDLFQFMNLWIYFYFVVPLYSSTCIDSYKDGFKRFEIFKLFFFITIISKMNNGLNGILSHRSEITPIHTNFSKSQFQEKLTAIS